MAAGKWIGGFLGFINGGPLGALAGFAIGWLFDAATSQTPTSASQWQQRQERAYDHRQQAQYEQQAYEGQRNSFLFSLLVLASYIIRADGRVMHSEMQTVRQFLRLNFGEEAVSEGDEILRKLLEHQKQVGPAAFRSTIHSACAQIAQHMDYAQRLQLLNFLVVIAQADGSIAPEEMTALREVTTYLGLQMDELDSMLNMRNGSTSLDAAYKVLGIAPTATDAEVKAAYRQMALKHHPDRVATLGDDVKKAAQRKFQDINNAKEAIFKARGIK